MRTRKKSVQRKTLWILGVNIPRGMAKRSISSLSPNSLSAKRYSRVFMIRDTKSRGYDEGHKIPISDPSLSFSYLNFGMGFATLLPSQGRIRAHFVFYFKFFCHTVRPKRRPWCFENGNKSTAFRKNKKRERESSTELDPGGPLHPDKRGGERGRETGREGRREIWEGAPHLASPVEL